MINRENKKITVGFVLGVIAGWLLAFLIPGRAKSQDQKHHGLIGLTITSLLICLWLRIWIVPSFAIAFAPFAIVIVFIVIYRTFGKFSLVLCFWVSLLSFAFVILPHFWHIALELCPGPIRAYYQSVQTKQEEVASDLNHKTKYKQYQIKAKDIKAQKIQNELDRINQKRENGTLTPKDQARESQLQQQIEKLLNIAGDSPTKTTTDTPIETKVVEQNKKTEDKENTPVQPPSADNPWLQKPSTQQAPVQTQVLHQRLHNTWPTPNIQAKKYYPGPRTDSRSFMERQGLNADGSQIKDNQNRSSNR